jgi:hypothetical protein
MNPAFQLTSFYGVRRYYGMNMPAYVPVYICVSVQFDKFSSAVEEILHVSCKTDSHLNVHNSVLLALALRLLYAVSTFTSHLFYINFYPEDEESMFLRNVRICLQVNTFYDLEE